LVMAHVDCEKSIYWEKKNRETDRNYAFL